MTLGLKAIIMALIQSDILILFLCTVGNLRSVRSVVDHLKAFLYIVQHTGRISIPLGPILADCNIHNLIFTQNCAVIILHTVSRLVEG